MFQNGTTPFLKILNNILSIIDQLAPSKRFLSSSRQKDNFLPISLEPWGIASGGVREELVRWDGDSWRRPQVLAGGEMLRAAAAQLAGVDWISRQWRPRGEGIAGSGRGTERTVNSFYLAVALHVISSICRG